MQLPNDGTKLKWPPEEYKSLLDQYAEAAAWYEGDPAGLAQHYGSQALKTFARGTRFWERVYRNARAVAVHVPLAADLAQASAQLLFGTAPTVTVPDAQPTDKKKADPQAVKCQDRLEVLLDDVDANSKWVEGAETCAGLGDVYLKADHDDSVADHPLLTVVQPDCALPTFKWGRLQDVTFWREVERDERVVFRHLEWHTKDGVENALYKGTPAYLGVRVPLDTLKSTADLLDTDASIDGELNVVHIPNMLPNRRLRGEPYGMADFAACYDLLEALDEVYTSLMRDVRLGASRLLVPEDYLDVTNTNGELHAAFDAEREIFCPVNFDSPDGKPLLQEVQFAIRWQEHREAALDLMSRVVSAAGYAMQTFSLGQDTLRAEAAAALRVKERRSLMTKARKERYWHKPLEYIIHRLQVLDAAYFDSGVVPYPVSLAFGDSYAPDTLELAQTVELWNRAAAASDETKVRLLHPEWDDQQVEAEVDALAPPTPPAFPPDASGAFGTQRETPPLGRPSSKATREQVRGKGQGGGNAV